MISNKAQTAERPIALQTDALARYSFARKYCKGKTILDVGTGFGMGANLIAKSGATSVLGVDYSKDAIKQASSNNTLKNLRFRSLNAFELNKIDEQFDVVLAFEIIEHLPVTQVAEFITLLYERVKPGGLLLLTTPNGRKSRFLLGRLYNPYHVKEYRDDELNALLSGYFTTVDVKGYKMINKKYLATDAKITQSFVYTLSYFLGHFRIVRELLGLIPPKIKHLVTKENTLPTLTAEDYALIDNPIDCYCYFIVAQKASLRQSYSPSVSIIIANYNGENFLPRCLEAVLKSDYQNYEVIICDDGSTDRSREIIRNYAKKNSNIVLIKNKSNMGASKSRNLASRRAKGEIVVFLDNDTQVSKSWLGNLLKPFSNDVRVGAAQAVLLDMDRPTLIQHAGGQLAPQVGWLMPFLQWKSYTKFKAKIVQRNIIGVSTALAVRRQVNDYINGFDELEAVHTEDIDYCWRVWIAGYKVVLANESIVYHQAKSVESRTTMNTNFYKIYFHLAKNSFRSLFKNYEMRNVVRYVMLSVVINFARGVLVAFRRKDFSALMATVMAVLWNLHNLADTIDTRTQIQSTRVLSDDYIRGEVFDQSGLIEIYNRNFRQTKLLW